MKLLNQLADAALRRVMPSAVAEAAVLEYRCRVGTNCPGYSGYIWSNERRSCDSPGVNCTRWNHFQCCYQVP